MNKEPVNEQIIRQMAGLMAHRGPDDEGFLVDENIGLGFRRLSIIDLSSGNQPMSDNEKNIWLIFNGEIYNFPELKRELQNRGHVFRTKSDTEVIIYGYKQWGIDVLNHLNGMFGLALWDNKKRRLLLARDGMGIKPLYYSIRDNRLAFSSEIKPIFIAFGQKSEIDPYSVSLFLRFRYTPSPLTIYDEIRKLAAGTCLIVEEGKAPLLKRWYTYAPEPFDPMPKAEDAAEMLLDIYRKAVKRHLLSDVPVSLLLSGGIDSSLLLSLMKELGTSWNTYTIGYGETFKDDEMLDAKRTADSLGMPNYGVKLTIQEFENTLAETIRSVEEPVATSSIVPMFHVSKRAGQDVKVALMGQGPDELFGGYPRHIGIRYGTYWRLLPKHIRHFITSSLGLFTRNESVRRSAYSMDVEPRLKRYQNVFSIIPAGLIENLFQKGLLPSDTNKKIEMLWADLLPFMGKIDELGGFQFIELRSSLPDELLIYGDKLSMKHSLEVRVPYLDKEIVEFVQRLPDSYKVRNGVQKWLHKKVCRKLLPSDVVNRKKRGFATNVVDGWFRNSMSKKFDAVFNCERSRIYQYLNYSVVQSLYQSHKAGRENNYKILFSMIVLEHIMQEYT
jgi:asparagine synthase (glutamine-hydrolysing)